MTWFYRKVYLPISRPKKGKMFVECTMRKSKLEKDEINAADKQLNVTAGQAVEAFVIGVSAD